jgi:hypothetical protein
MAVPKFYLVVLLSVLQGFVSRGVSPLIFVVVVLGVLILGVEATQGRALSDFGLP